MNLLVAIAWFAFAYGAGTQRKWSWYLGLGLAGLTVVDMLIILAVGGAASLLIVLAAIWMFGYLLRPEARTTLAPAADIPSRVVIVTVPTGLLGALVFVLGLAALTSVDKASLLIDLVLTVLAAGWLAAAYGVWRLARWGWLLGFAVAAITIVSVVIAGGEELSVALVIIVSALLAAGLWWIRGYFRGAL